MTPPFSPALSRQDNAGKPASAGFIPGLANAILVGYGKHLPETLRPILFARQRSIVAGFRS